MQLTNNTSTGKLATDRLTFQAIDGVDQDVSIRLFEGQRTGISAVFFGEVQILSSKATGNVSISVEPEEAVSIAIGQIDAGGSVVVDSSNNHLPSSKSITVFSALGVPSTISARNDLTLRGSTISFLSGAVVRSLEGSIRVFAGGAVDQSPANFQDNQVTPNLTLEIHDPFFIAFGPNSINALGSNNTIRAMGGTVILNTHDSPPNAITLRGNVEISAGSNNSLVPISCTESTYKDFPSTIEYLRSKTFVLAHLYGLQGVIGSDVIELKTGSCLLAARMKTSIRMNGLDADLNPGSVALLIASKNGSQLINLGCTPITTSQHGYKDLLIEPGQELRARPPGAPSDHIARRRVSSMNRTNDMEFILSELSLPSLFCENQLLRLYRRTDIPEHRKVLRDILRTGAALFAITSSHRGYAETECNSLASNRFYFCIQYGQVDERKRCSPLLRQRLNQINGRRSLSRLRLAVFS